MVVVVSVGWVGVGVDEAYVFFGCPVWWVGVGVCEGLEVPVGVVEVVGVVVVVWVWVDFLGYCVVVGWEGVGEGVGGSVGGVGCDVEFWGCFVFGG